MNRYLLLTACLSPAVAHAQPGGVFGNPLEDHNEEIVISGCSVNHVGLEIRESGEFEGTWEVRSEAGFYMGVSILETGSWEFDYSLSVSDASSEFGDGDGPPPAFNAKVEDVALAPGSNFWPTLISYPHVPVPGENVDETPISGPPFATTTTSIGIFTAEAIVAGTAIGETTATGLGVAFSTLSVSNTNGLPRELETGEFPQFPYNP